MAAALAVDTGTVAVGTVAVETAVVVGSIVAAGSTVVVVASVIVATAEMTPRKYFAVAIVAVDIADMGLVAVASFIPLTTLHNTLSI